MRRRIDAGARRIVGHWRRNGFLALAWGAMRRIVSPFADVSIRLLLEKDLTAPISPASARVRLRIVEAREQELASIVQEILAPEQAAGAAVNAARAKEMLTNLADRMRRGEKCFVGWVGPRPAHINWTCFQYCEGIAGFPIRLVEDEVCTTDAYTAAPFRGQAIHEAVLSHMLVAAKAMGRRRAFTLVDIENRRSRSGLNRVGWRTFGVVLAVRPRWLSRTVLLRLRGRIDPLQRPPT